MTTTNLSKYTWIALLVGALLVTCTQKAAAEDPTAPDDWQGQLANLSIGTNGSETDITISTENDVTSYTVKTPVGLAWIAKVTNEGKKSGDDGADSNYPAKAGFEDCIVKLDPTTTPPGNTLDLSEHLWVPIGNNFNKPFKGTFDGNHKMIAGLKVKVNNTNSTGYWYDQEAIAGLFGRLASNSKVSNLGIKVETASDAINETGNTPTGEIEASSTNGDSDAGALAGYNSGTIENCFVSGTGTICSKSTYSYGSAFSGGLIGSNGGTITHCYTTVNVVANGTFLSYAGGIIGDIIRGSTFQIKNVYATGKVEATGSSENYAGGITGGYIYGELSNVLALNKDEIIGTINTNNKSCGVGRITGFIPKDKESNLTACYASTKIRMNGKVKGESRYYDWQSKPSDAYHFSDGLTADTDTDLSTILKEGANDNAWTFSADNLPILAGFDNSLQTALTKTEYLDAPLDLSASQAQYSNTDGDSYTLTYSDKDGWKYTKGEAEEYTSNGTATSFSGRVKSTSEATADLTITNSSNVTGDESPLYFANGTSWTGGNNKVALTISANSKPVALFSEGTVTIKSPTGSLSVPSGAICRFASENHFHLYGLISHSGTLQGLMQWEWANGSNALTSDISVFWTGGSTTIPVSSISSSYTLFATNPGGKDITLKLGDNYQRGKKSGSGNAVSTFNFDDDDKTYVYYTNMEDGTKGEKEAPYTVNLADPSTGASTNGYMYSNNIITLTSPGSYYSLEGEAATNSILTLSTTATNASTTAYHLLATSGSKADILKVPSGTNCTIEGSNTLAATTAQVEGSLTLNAPVTLARTMTSNEYCLDIYNNGSVTVNSMLRATATSEQDYGTAIRIGDYTNPGTLTIGSNGAVYAYGKNSACYIGNKNATLTINNNGILRMASSLATINSIGNINAPIISWNFSNIPKTFTVKSDNDDCITFSSEVFGFDISSAKVFATNVAKETDYTLYNNAGKQLSGVNEVNTKTQTFRVKEGVSSYTAVGIPLSNITNNSDMTITSDKYQINNGEKQDYSGIISGITLNSLTVDEYNSYALLDNVAIGTLNVGDKLFYLNLNNSNSINTIIINAGGTLQIDKNDNGTLTIPANGTVTNNGTLTDNSAQITKVAGAAALEITSPQNATAPTGKAITLTATAVGADGASVQGNWYKWNAKDNHWENYPASLTQSSLQQRSATPMKTFTIDVTEEGSYRCWISCTKEESDEKTVTTNLTTKSATATFTTSGGDDNPGDDDSGETNPPVFYTVTLPAVEGATTDPAAGSYEVEAWDSFRFYLTLDAAYDQSTPVVTTDRGETLEPRSSDGAYIVKYVRNDTDIRIDGIVKNTPDVGNEAIASDGVKVWATASQLHIHAATPTDIYIYHFAGGLLKQFTRLSGDKTIALPQGNYIVAAGKQKFKVQVK